MKKRIFSFLLAGLMFCCSGMTVWATTEDEIAYAQEQKQEAENDLAKAQAEIGSLESKKQELEVYLAQLNAQYEELSNSVNELESQQAELEAELAEIQVQLEKAKEAAARQYDAMKIRIVYMYEHGGSSLLEQLLSSKNLADFLNKAENVSQISRYDRDMLKKYEELQNSIRQQEEMAQAETLQIEELKQQKAVKQQEVQEMAAGTSASITSYVNQISASEAEATMLMEQISSANNSISALMAQAAAEQAAAEQAAAEQAAADQSPQESQTPPDFDPDTDTMDSSSSSSSSVIIVEEEDDEDMYESPAEEPAEEETSSNSGQGTYLGNFRLTGYCGCAQCCGTAGKATASGVMPSAGHTVAMAGVPFGTQLSINGTIYTVEDLGTPYGHVDIFFSSHQEALNFGSQYADVYQVN